MESVFEVNVVHVHVLDDLERPIVLPNAANGDAQTVVKLGINDCYVSAICLQTDAVVAVVHCPVVKLDSRRSDRVGAVRVGCSC